MKRNRPLRLVRRAIVILLCLIFIAAMWAAAQSSYLLEHVYARGIGFQISRGLSVVSGLSPVSLAEIALAGVAAYFLVPLVRTSLRVLRRERGLVNAIAGGLLRLSTAVAVIVAVFYLVWGLNYSRAPLPARLGWPPVEARADGAAHQRQVDELATLAAELVDATNAAYREATGGDDAGRPSERPGGAPGLDAALDAAYVGVQQRLGLEAPFAVARGRARPVLASAIMNYLGLSGFYFPWTGEANYNRLQPAPTRPHSMAHEKAHQRGIAPEDEAGFIGYLACALSDDAYTRYSGGLYAQHELLAELARFDLARARALVSRRLPGVQRDVDFIRSFWLGYEGPATRVSLSVNDRYLKAQGMKGGVQTYAASRNLIVLFARQNGGKVWVRD